VLLTIGSCSSDTPVAKGTVVSVELRDFRIVASRTSVAAGRVTFRVHNRGPSTHEFIVDRTELASYALPLRKDGISVDEESKRVHGTGTIEEVFDRHTVDLTVNLTRGHYVMYCNMEGHYMGDMRAGVDVP
jgi:uncharacterized cupredoxin-like copper-binding protein